MEQIGYAYILLCANEKYYTGSTIDLDKRLIDHQSGLGANFTRKNLPFKLVYVETFERIDQAFAREKQIQGWSHKKKEALIDSAFNILKKLSECQNESHANSIYSHFDEDEKHGPQT
ncbi:MAG: GIY-YIG nuclease family protein [Saprospiraceae bacterium]